MVIVYLTTWRWWVRSCVVELREHVLEQQLSLIDEHLQDGRLDWQQLGPRTNVRLTSTRIKTSLVKR